MIIDFKYHIASLIAVFLALGLGIFIGTSLGYDNRIGEAILKQQKQLTLGIEKRLDELKKKNDELEALNEELEVTNKVLKQYQEETLPVLIKGKLTGKKVAIVVTGYYGLNDEVKEVLKKAGAEIVSVTEIIPEELTNPADIDYIKSQMKWQTKDKKEFYTKFALEVGKNLLTPGDGSTLLTLAKTDALKITGKYGVPLDGVVVIGGGLNESDLVNYLDLPLIKFLKTVPVVIGGEYSNVEKSYIKFYQKERITTIDDLDLPSGQLSLVYGLLGVKGDYGIKSTAKRLIPPMGQ
ncbi:copper transporter [Carboxydothermus hydrogenoformans]|uniref:Copper transporter n=1 Tax=Carboxydothermus hydrogenoformans (strain ATCC BAA-161 / DSM 6008 / Z-2901) TaxID=246194 RepID=Q3AAN9_CARHZ|nr:copper transporter [Carboxydothermus hydrogenoformans]ABB16022.1 conserved hypothetical protein [Carboxydothermus hydrogenoformans Z-2901]